MLSLQYNQEADLEILSWIWFSGCVDPEILWEDLVLLLVGYLHACDLCVYKAANNSLLKKSKALALLPHDHYIIVFTN